MSAGSLMYISSSVFTNGGNIPSEYTCDGSGTNPPLTITSIPAGAKTLVLIMDDPDAPGGTFDHWIVWNIPPQEIIKGNSDPGKTGKNSLGENRYTGPCPPSGTHRYFFKVYALDIMLQLPDSADKTAVEKAIGNHVLATGELIGLYKREKNQ